MASISRHSDLLEQLEDLMAEIGNLLRIKYGLGHDPSPEKAEEWARRTRDLIEQGRGREEAGQMAAQQIWRDYRTHFYASEADNLESLLQQAGGKDKPK